jgi:hypothetical protein
MANEMLKFRKGLFKNLPEVSANTVGTIFVTTDEQAMYVDVAADKRIRISDFIRVSSVKDITPPYSTSSLYYVEADNALLKYVETTVDGVTTGTWKQVNGTDDLKDRIGAAETAIGTINGTLTTHGTAIEALELLVGNKAVATQISEAIAAENLAQYAKAADLETTNGNVTALTNKVDTGDKTVSAYVSAAIDAIKIGDYAKAADLALLAGRVTTLEGKVADLEAADIAMDARVVAMEGKVAKWDAAEANAKAYADSLANNYDAAGAAATAEANAKAHADSEITRRVVALTTDEIDAAIASASAQV